MNQNELQEKSDKLDELISNIENHPIMYFSSINSLCEGYVFLLSVKYTNISTYRIHVALRDKVMSLSKDTHCSYMSLLTNLKLEDLPYVLKNFRKYCENIEFV